MNKFSHYLSVTVKGVCMGAADVIPGVSGGTIAFLMGIYGELVDSIKSVNPHSLKLLFTGKLARFWKHINGNFLLSLILGILISVFSLAKLMKYLMENQPIQLWSFFFGLILASAVFILKGIDKWNIKNILSLAVGIVAAAFICFATPAETPNHLWFIFLCGAIAICAMILPGISGSFILLLMGKYDFIMSAVAGLDIKILIIFGCGALIGIVLFSHFLSWLLKRFYMQTIALLAGFMIGSLFKVWPWKELLEKGTDVPVLPNTYSQLTGSEPLVGYAVIFAVIGIVALIVIELLANNKEKEEEKELKNN